ncbi:MAG: hypothetical protein Q9226_008251 [Calogaya cf. arnoldii]
MLFSHLLLSGLIACTGFDSVLAHSNRHAAKRHTHLNGSRPDVLTNEASKPSLRMQQHHAHILAQMQRCKEENIRRAAKAKAKAEASLSKAQAQLSKTSTAKSSTTSSKASSTGSSIKPPGSPVTSSKTSAYFFDQTIVYTISYIGQALCVAIYNVNDSFKSIISWIFNYFVSPVKYFFNQFVGSIISYIGQALWVVIYIVIDNVTSPVSYIVDCFPTYVVS